jgi:protein ImuB
MQKRVISLWFPRLPTDRALRMRGGSTAPFALTQRIANTERLYGLNARAEVQGLNRGMTHSDARAFCPDLQSRPADLPGDARFLAVLARWATRYCPWVGLEGADGLVLDVTGAAHLWGGEAALLADLRARLHRAGLEVRIGLADTRGAAWALAHYGEGVAAAGAGAAVMAALPIAALRLPDATCVALQRLGLRRVADVIALPRATLTRRFGPELLLRLDQALGARAEQLSPLPDPPIYSARLTLPDPIGLISDVMAGTERLLIQLCARLKEREMGARVLQLTLRRVDQAQQQVELRLARPLHDPARILPLFQRGTSEVDAGYGIDQLRLEAVQVEPLPAAQLRSSNRRAGEAGGAQLDDLMTRLGNRVGLENIIRFLPADSHIPERGFLTAAAAYSDPAKAWAINRPRPLRLFTPEAIAAAGPQPPPHFRWRRMALTTARATGPERIAPEWWLEDRNWRSGLRDYWRVETRQGRRLWMFHTPQDPGWYVQGEFA